MIDWAVFDKFPETTCRCACGARYRSHAKVVMTGRPHLVSRKPCPVCQLSAPVASSSDVEVVTIRKENT